MFSQWAEYEVPDYVEAMLMSIRSELSRVLWNINQREIDPFGNTGEVFEDSPTFKVRAYDWGKADGEDPMEPNFEWKDFKVMWYKYFGRGMSCNRDMKPHEAAKMLSECLEAITQYEKENDETYRELHPDE